MVFKVAIVQCRGTPYEIGLAQAQSFAQTSKGRAFLRRKTHCVSLVVQARCAEAHVRQVRPRPLAGDRGLADGLGVPLERAVYHFGNGGLRPPIGGCSAVMSNGVYGRNYDYRARYYDARLALIQPSG